MQDLYSNNKGRFKARLFFGGLLCGFSSLIQLNGESLAIIASNSRLLKVLFFGHDAGSKNDDLLFTPYY